MALNFGVDRLLAKCDKKFERNLIHENLMSTKSCQNDISSDNDKKTSSETENNRLEINLLHQQLTNANNGFFNHNYLLKPFPLRFGRNENGEKNFIVKTQ